MALTAYPWQDGLAAEFARLREAMPNAVLCYGPPGVGAFEATLSFARSLLCAAADPGARPCDQCRACAMTRAHSHPDLVYVVSASQSKAYDLPCEEPDNRRSDAKPSAEILIHQTRRLNEILQLKTSEGGWRPVLVYPADRLRAEAAASLLKSIEEPPPRTVFLLVSENIDRVLPTIRSRCRLLRVVPPTTEQALAWLRENGVEDAPARLAEAGGMPLAALAEGDGVTALTDEQRARLLTALKDAPGKKDIGRLLRAVDRATPLAPGLLLLSRWGWDLAAVRAGQAPRFFPAERAALVEAAARTDAPRLYRWLNSVAELRRWAEHPLNARLIMEGLLTAYQRIFD